MPSERMVVRVPQETSEAVERIRRNRFGGAFGGKQQVIVWAVRVLSLVLAEDSARLALTPDDALARYCAAKARKEARDAGRLGILGSETTKRDSGS